MVERTLLLRWLLPPRPRGALLPEALMVLVLWCSVVAFVVAVVALPTGRSAAAPAEAELVRTEAPSLPGWNGDPHGADDGRRWGLRCPSPACSGHK